MANSHDSPGAYRIEGIGEIHEDTAHLLMQVGFLIIRGRKVTADALIRPGEKETTSDGE